jgi:hypothetical protein
VGIAIIHFFLAFIFETYIIDSEFLSNLVNIKKSPKNVEDDDVNKMKCYPNKSNKAPYQKIEFQLRKDRHWPPITPASAATVNENNTVNNSNNVVTTPQVPPPSSTSTDRHRFLSRNHSSSSRKRHCSADEHAITNNNINNINNSANLNTIRSDVYELTAI